MWHGFTRHETNSSELVTGLPANYVQTYPIPGITSGDSSLQGPHPSSLLALTLTRYGWPLMSLEMTQGLNWEYVR